MGRPKKYEGDGAPYLGLRLEPQIHEHIRNQPEGPRAYVERLVTEDMEKSGERLVDDAARETDPQSQGE